MADFGKKQYDNNMRGTLGKNRRRENDKQPEYNGRCEIDGREYYISAWLQENKSDGSKFFSLAFRAKDEVQQRDAQRSQEPRRDDRRKDEDRREDKRFGEPRIEPRYDDADIPF